MLCNKHYHFLAALFSMWSMMQQLDVLFLPVHKRKEELKSLLSGDK
jgi:hypothetical protein